MAFRRHVNDASWSVAVARRGANVSHRMSVGLWLLYQRLLTGNDAAAAATAAALGQAELDTHDAAGEIRVGSVLSGRYVVRGDAGRGRLSRVVRADDLYLRRGVALKLFHSAYSLLGRQEHTRLLLLNQADQRDLCHVVRLLDAFELEHHYCLVLELLEPLEARMPLARATTTTTTTLSAAVAGTSVVEVAAMAPLSHELLREVAQQLLFALAFLRQYELLHADLKPENIMAVTPVTPVTPATVANEAPHHDIYRLRIKLADFSNAMSSSETSCYHDHFEVQSLPYRAPEVRSSSSSSASPCDRQAY